MRLSAHFRIIEARTRERNSRHLQLRPQDNSSSTFLLICSEEVASPEYRQRLLSGIMLEPFFDEWAIHERSGTSRHFA